MVAKSDVCQICGKNMIFYRYPLNMCFDCAFKNFRFKYKIEIPGGDEEE